MTGVPPIRREIVVELGADDAFELFTARLATDEDPSVKGGFFQVSVRPWQVMMTSQLVQS